MLHNVTLEKLLAFPDDVSHSNVLRRTQHFNFSPEPPQSSKGVKRKLSTTICEEKKAKYRHHANPSCTSLHPSKPKTKANFDSTFNGLCSSGLKISESPKTSHWCYTKICPKKLEFTWTIDNFSLSVTAPGETVVSRSFPVHTNKDYVWSLHVAPHGKCPELRDYVSVCLVMESKGRRELPLPHPATATATASTDSSTAALLPARFRCSLLDQHGRVTYTNETERYHLVGPKMGLGFCRFIERSRLYSPLKPPGALCHSMPGQKEAASIPPPETANDNCLVGPGDQVKLFAEIFWIEEEIYASPSEDAFPTCDPSDMPVDCIAETEMPADLQGDLERLLLSHRLTDVTVTVDTTRTPQIRDNSVHVDIPGSAGPVACDCHDCVNRVERKLEFYAHKAILAASSPKLLRIFSSKTNGCLHQDIQRLIFRGPDLFPDVIPIFLRYVYTRKIDRSVNHAHLVSVLRLSSQLEMPDLHRLVQQRLVGVLSVENICSILTAAIDLDASRLVGDCLSYVFRNVENIIKSTGYQSLCTKRLDVLSFLFCQLAHYRGQNLSAPLIVTPAPPLLSPQGIHTPRPFTFSEDSPITTNSYDPLIPASGLSPVHRKHGQALHQQHQQHQQSQQFSTSSSS